jgi:hypothetical protein
VDFVVCTLAVKKEIRAGFDMSDRTIALLVSNVNPNTPTCERILFTCVEQNGELMKRSSLNITPVGGPLFE